METEKEKMLQGQLYQASDQELVNERLHARKLTRLYNQTEETDREIRASLLKQLFGSLGTHSYVEPPFRCDYGYNIHVSRNGYLAACKFHTEMEEQDEYGPYMFLSRYEYAHLARQWMPASLSTKDKREWHRGFVLGWNSCTLVL